MSLRLAASPQRVSLLFVASVYAVGAVPIVVGAAAASGSDHASFRVHARGDIAVGWAVVILVVIDVGAGAGAHINSDALSRSSAGERKRGKHCADKCRHSHLAPPVLLQANRPGGDWFRR